MEKILKSGINKGNRRIWIEGSILIQNHWHNGQRFNKRIEGGILTLISESKGQHKVAGTATRPIIDLNGKYLNEFMGDHTHFAVQFFDVSTFVKLILIHPCNEGGS